jgi:hypothetical protein
MGVSPQFHQKLCQGVSVQYPLLGMCMVAGADIGGCGGLDRSRAGAAHGLWGWHFAACHSLEILHFSIFSLLVIKTQLATLGTGLNLDKNG